MQEAAPLFHRRNLLERKVQKQGKSLCNRSVDRDPWFTGLAVGASRGDAAEVSAEECGEADADPVVVECGGDSEA